MSAKFLKSVNSVPGSGETDVVFTNGTTSQDLGCAQFFMTMEQRGADLAEMRAYANIGPTLSPTVDWDEINRVLATFN